MKLNNKGFTLIEILAAVAIMSILSGVAVMAVTRYIEKTQREAYEIMQKTVYDAAASYHQNNPNVINIDIDISTLKTEGYLESLQDPSNKNEDCSGTVTISKTGGSATVLDSYTYTVNLQCEKYHESDKTFTS